MVAPRVQGEVLRRHPNASGGGKRFRCAERKVFGRQVVVNLAISRCHVGECLFADTLTPPKIQKKVGIFDDAILVIESKVVRHIAAVDEARNRLRHDIAVRSIYRQDVAPRAGYLPFKRKRLQSVSVLDNAGVKDGRAFQNGGITIYQTVLRQNLRLVRKPGDRLLGIFKNAELGNRRFEILDRRASAFLRAGQSPWAASSFESCAPSRAS